MASSSVEKTMPPFDPEAKYTQIVERVANQDRQIVDLERMVREGFRDLNSAISDMRSEAAAAAKTPWGTLSTVGSLGLAIVIAIGSLAYWPIRDAIIDIRGVLVPRPEYMERMRSITNELIDQQRQLDRMQKFADELYSPKDAMRRMDDRINRLENTLKDPK